MTQEEKSILLKDLCGRLPYGVMMKGVNDDFVLGINTPPTRLLYVLTSLDFKPYLRPMLSMTEEEYNKYELTFDNVVVYSGHNNNNIHSEHRPTYETFDYLDSIHVDYRGLIPMGLALEAPKDMYNF